MFSYWGHPGMWTTETTHLSGAYCPADYGCGDRTGWPDYLEQSGYLHVDQGGDSGTGEYAVMALDYLLWASDDASRPSQRAKECVHSTVDRASSASAASLAGQASRKQAARASCGALQVG